MHIKIEEKHRRILSKYKYLRMSRFGEEPDGREMMCVVPTDDERDTGIIYTYEVIDKILHNNYKYGVFYLSWKNEIHETVVIPFEKQ